MRTGQVFTCGAPLTPEEYPKELADTHGFQELGFEHRMLNALEFEEGKFAAGDRISVTVHSLHNTHLDAFSHVGHHGKGFNGVPVGEMVTVEGGATHHSIVHVGPIVTRGVLLDVPRLRGIDYLTPGTSVTLEDMESVADVVQPGDAIIVRTGRWHAPVVRPGDPGSSGDIHGDWPGLHADCMGFVRDHDLALVGTDSVGETFPLPTPHVPTIHILAEVYLGVPLLHSMVLDELAAACAEQGRKDFMITVSPLLIPGGTGSPVTPVCIL